MSEHSTSQNSGASTPHNPTIYDLHAEQIRQGTLLTGLCDDTKAVKDVLIGTDRKDGLVLEVDRLKRSKTLLYTFMWAIFITALGVAGTALASFIQIG